LDLTAEKTLLVASVAPATNAEALEAAREAQALPPDAAVELRLDSLREAPAFAALRAAFVGRILVATLRSKSEGGEFGGRREEEKSCLEGALAAGFDLVDVEFRRAEEARGSGERRAAAFPLSIPLSQQILSLHDPAGIPSDLGGVLSRMLSSGARYVKLVATPNDVPDVLRLLELQAAHRDGRTAVFGMGEAGLATRALAPYLGAALAFGALVPGRATAPAQVSARDLVDVYGIGRPRPVARLFALLGDRVSHSLSPALHGANFEALATQALYVPFALRSLGRELPALVAGLDALGLPLVAASVTIPFKEEAAHLAESEETALNTLVRVSGPGAAPRWKGSNTDREAFEAVIPDAAPGERGGAGRNALVLGAGGTARIAVEVLRRRGWEVGIVNRGAPRGEALAKATGALYLSKKSPAALPSPRVVVNATPLGLRPEDAFPCDQELLRVGVLVVDAPYRAGGTDLVRAARAAGCRVVDGQTLLLLQAAGQASRFTGRETTPQDLLARLAPRLRAHFSPLEESLPALSPETAR
jgi:3-dehydroquinate dehydratase/shikimate dehydrogenase